MTLTTHNADFKVTLMFDAEYLSNVYKIETYLRWKTNRNSCAIYRAISSDH